MRASNTEMYGLLDSYEALLLLDDKRTEWRLSGTDFRGQKKAPGHEHEPGARLANRLQGGKQSASATGLSPVLPASCVRQRT